MSYKKMKTVKWEFYSEFLSNICHNLFWSNENDKATITNHLKVAM